LYEALKPCNFFFSSTLMADSSNLKSSNSSAKVFCFCALSAQGLAACRLKAEDEREGEEGRVRIGELRLRATEGRRKLWATCASRLMPRRTRRRRRAGCWRRCSIWELRMWLYVLVLEGAGSKSGRTSDDDVSGLGHEQVDKDEAERPCICACVCGSCE